MQRSSIRRIYRWRESADLIYLGPNGLSGWRDTAVHPAAAPRRGVPGEPDEVNLGAGQASDAIVAPSVADSPAGGRGWRDEAGQLMTDQEGAAIHGDFGIPARATIEFEISWKKKPDFVLALGTSDEPDTVKRAFRFEAWGTDLIVQRELEKEADLAVVQEIGTGPGRAHFQVYLDQEENKVIIFSGQGKQLASLKVGLSKSRALSGVDLKNLRGDLRLEWLRIVRWSGEPPREVQADSARIHCADGSIVYGQVTGLDAGSGQFIVKSGSLEKRIAPEKISSVFLSAAGQEKPRGLRVVYQNGSRYSGELQRVENGVLVLAVPGVAQPLRLPVAGLRSLLILTRDVEQGSAKEESTGQAIDPRRSARRQAGRLQRQAGRNPAGLAARRERDRQRTEARYLGSNHLQRAACSYSTPARDGTTAAAQDHTEAAACADASYAACTGAAARRRSHGDALLERHGRADDRSQPEGARRRTALALPARRRRDPVCHHQDR